VQKASSVDDVDFELAVDEVASIIRDVEDYLRKVRAGVIPRNPEIAMKLNKKLARALKTAKRLGMEEEYMRLMKLKAQLSVIE
jgi:hypothetical protein